MHAYTMVTIHRIFPVKSACRKRPEKIMCRLCTWLNEHQDVDVDSPEASNILEEINLKKSKSKPTLAIPPMANIVRMPHSSATKPASIAPIGPIPQLMKRLAL